MAATAAEEATRAQAAAVVAVGETADTWWLPDQLVGLTGVS